jgi:hypothetical protein
LFATGELERLVDGGEEIFSEIRDEVDECREVGGSVLWVEPAEEVTGWMSARVRQGSGECIQRRIKRIGRHAVMPGDIAIVDAEECGSAVARWGSAG